MIEVIDNHSVRTDLLTKGPVLDAGARGFVFSRWFKDRGHEVHAMDPSPDITDKVAFEFCYCFYPHALVGANSVKEVFLNTSGDPGAWSIADKPSLQCVPVRCRPVTSLSTRETWDVIKLNIEGSEYEVLDTWPGPIARQIVVSFHEHTPRARGRAECDRLIDKMRQWYTPFNVIWEKRYCCSENYWDVLFVRNDLV